MLSKAECEHKNKIKSGKHLYRDGYYQMERCLDCGTVLKGNKITENVRPTVKKNAQIKPQNPIKEGGANDKEHS